MKLINKRVLFITSWDDFLPGKPLSDLWVETAQCHTWIRYKYINNSERWILGDPHPLGDSDWRDWTR